MSTNAFERALTAIGNHVKYIDDTAKAITAKGVQSSGKLKNFPSEIARIQGGGGSDMTPEVRNLIELIERKGWDIATDLTYIDGNLQPFVPSRFITSYSAYGLLQEGNFVISGEGDWNFLDVNSDRFHAYGLLKFRRYHQGEESWKGWYYVESKTKTIPLKKGTYNMNHPLNLGAVERLDEPSDEFDGAYIMLEYTKKNGEIASDEIPIFTFKLGDNLLGVGGLPVPPVLG